MTGCGVDPQMDADERRCVGAIPPGRPPFDPQMHKKGAGWADR